MPLIPAKPNDISDLFMRVITLWFTPMSANFSRRMIRQMDGHFLVAGAQKFPEHFKPTVEGLRRALEAPPEGIELPGAGGANNTKGLIAGMMLLATLRVAYYWPDKGSLENGGRIAEHYLKAMDLASSRAARMAAWTSHRSISHFWAAAIYEPEIFMTFQKALGIKAARIKAVETSNIAPINAQLIGRWLDDLPGFRAAIEQAQSDLIPRYLAIAERFRQLAERYYAPGQKKRGTTLLPPDTAWRIPPAFTLPPVEITFPRLNAVERNILNSSKKSAA